jgi:hypothetical protein
MIAFICTNDWFVSEYNMPYTKVGAGGTLVITNLNENLSLPRAKRGPMTGIEKRDIQAIVVDEDYFFWYDRKNTSIIKCNYEATVDISQQMEEERGGLQSYLNQKSWFISQHDNASPVDERFDVMMGIDGERGNVYITFRPRRKNTLNKLAFVNNRRFLDFGYQETFVYSIQYKGWLPCVNFTPESYGRLRGAWANVEFISFVGGVPYYHNNTANTSYLNFYGIQCEPVFMGVFNKKEDDNKILQAISQNINGSSLYADLIYESQPYSFSYIPANRWIEKEKTFYAEVLRDMNSYPPVDPAQLFRSMLFDGKRIFGPYMLCRFIQKYADLGKYFQFTGMNYLFTDSFTTKPTEAKQE